MCKISRRWTTLTALFYLAACGCLGCGAKESSPAKMAQQAASHFTTEVQTIQKAKSFKVGFDNPKMGCCPVCDKPVNYESFVTIGRKQYALCSDECAEKLLNDPGQYLSAPRP